MEVLSCANVDSYKMSQPFGLSTLLRWIKKVIPRSTIEIEKVYVQHAVHINDNI